MMIAGAVLVLQTAHGQVPSDPGTTISLVAESVGIDGRDWASSVSDATTVDAVHRSVLVRFPGAAAKISAALGSKSQISRAELVLDYVGYETAPAGYLVRRALGEKRWTEDPPQWHVVAWPLRRGWEKARGPTFNAYVGGQAAWAKYGAADTTSDRFPNAFGPAELSSANRIARIDVSAVLTDRVYGQDVGARLRGVENNGFLLRKQELYDARYREQGSAYDWAVPTGGHGLTFRNARLVVTLRTQENARVTPAAAAAPQTEMRVPPAPMLPSPDEFRRLAAKHPFVKPAAMADWQFERLTQLYQIGGDAITPWSKALAAGDYRKYESLVREMLATPPRFWKGWGIQDDLIVWFMYGDLLPPYVQDHVKTYWTSWLMPDIPTSELFPPHSKESIAWWTAHKDWRGRSSFFRDGYNYMQSTENFNHTAAMGALLGGSIVGSEYAVSDGRHGLEAFPLRLWSWLDGSTQEMLDHYYLSITLSGQKMFADYGPTRLDRLMGRVMLDRTMELLSTPYHPDLRRIVNASGRARISGVLVEQDGIYGALHTLSRRGVLNYLDRPFAATAHGLPIWGYDFPPGRVAMQSLSQGWAPDWMTQIIDEKTFPFEETSTETTRNNFNPPLWRRAYLGRHYGLASQDIKGGTVDVIAQWNRSARPAQGMEDVGTLTLRYAINKPDMATTAGGTMPYAGGTLTYQHRNRAIVFTKPRTDRDRIMQIAGPGGVTSLATVIALWNFKTPAGWEIQVDGQRVVDFPAKLRAGQVITVKDGPSYIGILPIPATDLGRDDEVVIGYGGDGTAERSKAPIRPALTITSYNLQRATPLRFDQLDWPAINTGAYGGFVIEMGDVADSGDFASFTRRIRGNKLDVSWEAARKLVNIAYRSGNDLMEAGFATDYQQSDVHYGVQPGQQTKAIPYRRINGKWPYLAPGVERDTTVAQQGTTGKLEKNGAVLLTQAGRKAYLLTEPVTGVYVGYNPLPDASDWTFTVPGGVAVRANGKVSLLRVEVQPRAGRISVDYAAKPDQSGPEMATHLLVSGLPQNGSVRVNGKSIDARAIMSQNVLRIPLS